ncbi:hypothetical protein AAF712_008772 [Marasmius tenuissimus]|uniref:Uncharacterized protein n=1 Tax=Marasmius tenuissimus TaxID=585030 RepID=A0ABR2ZRM0_9AGAR
MATHSPELYHIRTFDLQPIGASPSDSPLSSTSTLALDDDQIRSIFLSEKFADAGIECELPPTTIANLTDILDHVDIYDIRFGKELNPGAPPFTPKGACAPPSPPQALVPQLARVPSATTPTHRQSFSFAPPAVPLPQQSHSSAAWITVFHAVMSHPRPTLPVLAGYARDLVDAALWDESEEEIAELSKRLCFQAMMTDTNHDVLAPFAREVQLCLNASYGERAAQSFAWYMREGTMGVFKASWCTSVNERAISFHSTPSEEYVGTATEFLRFIGDLFSLGVLVKENISMCLSVLVYEMVSIEHIDAIGTLIESAQIEFWCRPGETKPSDEMMRRFINHFSMKADSLQDGVTPFSVLGRSAGPDERNAKVHEVLSMLSRWWGSESGLRL